MIGTGLAILGASVIGAGAGIYGANKAASAQEGAANNALNFQQGVYRDTQQNLKPFISTGQNALAKISSLYGLDGGNAFGPNTMAEFKSSPDYAFTLQEGVGALDNSAAARGRLMSGNHLRDLTTFGQGLASQQFGNYYNRLAGISQMGQSAAMGGGQLAAGQAGQIGNTMMGAGQAQASGIVGGTNAFTGSLNSGMNNYLLMNAMNKSSYGAPISSGYLPLSPASPSGWSQQYSGVPNWAGA